MRPNPESPSPAPAPIPGAETDPWAAIQQNIDALQAEAAALNGVPGTPEDGMAVPSVDTLPLEGRGDNITSPHAVIETDPDTGAQSVFVEEDQTAKAGLAVAIPQRLAHFARGHHDNLSAMASDPLLSDSKLVSGHQAGMSGSVERWGNWADRAEQAAQRAEDKHAAKQAKKRTHAEEQARYSEGLDTLSQVPRVETHKAPANQVAAKGLKRVVVGVAARRAVAHGNKMMTQHEIQRVYGNNPGDVQALKRMNAKHAKKAQKWEKRAGADKRRDIVETAIDAHGGRSQGYREHLNGGPLPEATPARSTRHETAANAPEQNAQGTPENQPQGERQSKINEIFGDIERRQLSVESIAELHRRLGPITAEYNALSPADRKDPQKMQEIRNKARQIEYQMARDEIISAFDHKYNLEEVLRREADIQIGINAARHRQRALENMPADTANADPYARALGLAIEQDREKELLGKASGNDAVSMVAKRLRLTTERQAADREAAEAALKAHFGELPPELVSQLLDHKGQAAKQEVHELKGIYLERQLDRQIQEMENLSDDLRDLIGSPEQIEALRAKLTATRDILYAGRKPGKGETNPASTRPSERGDDRINRAWGKAGEAAARQVAQNAIDHANAQNNQNAQTPATPARPKKTAAAPTSTRPHPNAKYNQKNNPLYKKHPNNPLPIGWAQTRAGRRKYGPIAAQMVAEAKHREEEAKRREAAKKRQTAKK